MSALSDVGVRLIDINGDGELDVIRSYDPGVSTTAYINNSKKVDLLTHVTNPAGGTVTYAYKQTPMYSAGGQLANAKLPIVLDTVNAVGVDDGFGTVSTTTYSYAGGTYYYAGPFDRKLSGFNRVTATDPAGNTTDTYYHTGNGTNSANGEYNDSKAKIGLAYRVEKRDASGNLYHKEITRWDQVSLGNNRQFVEALSTLASDYDGTASHRDSAVAYTYDNTTGNVLTKTEYGEVTGSNDGTFTDNIGNDARTTTYTYASSAGSNVIGLPSDEVVTDQSSTKVKETRHYYDGLSLGSISLGNETKTEGWKSGTSYASTTKTYNSYGLVTQSTDARGGRTLYGYDSYNLFVASTTDAAGLNTQYLYNYAIGKPKQTTDPNGLVFQTIFDGLGRLTEENQPDLTTPSNLVTKTTYAYVDTPLNVSVHKTVSLGRFAHTRHVRILRRSRSGASRRASKPSLAAPTSQRTRSTTPVAMYGKSRSRTSRPARRARAPTASCLALHHLRL